MKTNSDFSHGNFDSYKMPLRKAYSIKSHTRESQKTIYNNYPDFHRLESRLEIMSILNSRKEKRASAQNNLERIKQMMAKQWTIEERMLKRQYINNFIERLSAKKLPTTNKKLEEANAKNIKSDIKVKHSRNMIMENQILKVNARKIEQDEKQSEQAKEKYLRKMKYLEKAYVNRQAIMERKIDNSKDKRDKQILRTKVNTILNGYFKEKGRSVEPNDNRLCNDIDNLFFEKHTDDEINQVRICLLLDKRRCLLFCSI